MDEPCGQPLIGNGDFLAVDTQILVRRAAHRGESARDGIDCVPIYVAVILIASEGEFTGGMDGYKMRALVLRREW
jgi:hypothetical protein